MDDRTLEALRGSIAKWEAIVAGKQADRGGRDCPLCARFCPSRRWSNLYLVWRKHDCEGCPVLGWSGARHCWGTPYDAWSVHQRLHHRGMTRRAYPGCPSCERRAQAELDFLRSLLPADANARNTDCRASGSTDAAARSDDATP